MGVAAGVAVVAAIPLPLMVVSSEEEEERGEEGLDARLPKGKACSSSVTGESTRGRSR